MSTTARKTKGKYIHIFNKGKGGLDLFRDEEDYQTFMKFIEEYVTPPPNPANLKKSFSVNGRTYMGVPHQPKNYFEKVELVAYSLMQDHYHLIIKQLKSGATEKLLRSLFTRYAIYYNKRYQRKGSIFSGPYKSVKLDTPAKLLHLSRHIHLESEGSGGKSSYKEFIGERKTDWIRHDAILTFFEDANTNAFKGPQGYKKFVKDYELNQDEEKVLERVAIEKLPEDITTEQETVNEDEVTTDEIANEDNVLVPEMISDTKGNEVSQNINQPIKVPHFIATTTAIFVMLFGVGFRNVQITTAKTSETIASADIVSPTPAVSQTVAGTTDEKQEPKIIEFVIIAIKDGSNSVNIRKNSTTASSKVGKANEGERFELISEEDGWYEIVFEGEIAYVSSKYAVIEKQEVLEDNL